MIYIKKKQQKNKANISKRKKVTEDDIRNVLVKVNVMAVLDSS